MSTPTHSPVGHRILTLMIVFSLLGLPSIWLLGSGLNTLLMMVITTVTVLAILGVAIFNYFEGIVSARYFVLIRLSTMTATFILIFSAYGLLPNISMGEWLMPVVVIFEGLAFVWVMVFRQMKKTVSQKQVVKEDNKLDKYFIPVASYCHELRTPISGVMGMTELLLDTSLTEQQKVQVQTVRRSGKALLDVVNKMSYLSSLEQGGIELVDNTFEINAVIESCVEDSRSLSERKCIELIYHIDENISYLVNGDQEKLQQVLNNLVSYVVSQLDAGEVLISVSELEGGDVFFEVQAKNNTNKQKNSLSKAGEMLTSASKLSLTIAHQFVALMGGKLSIQYDTTSVRSFFQLPLKRQRISHGVEGDIEILVGKKILVVDDNDTCCQIIQQQVSHWGMDVTTALSGFEALEIIKSRSALATVFDVILVDYDMPGMNGLELVSELRKLQKDLALQDIVVMVLTGVSKMPGQLVDSGLNIHRVLYKPLSGKNLKLALIEVF